MSRRGAARAVLFAAAIAGAAAARAEGAPLVPLVAGETHLALLDGAYDRDGWRVGVVRSRYGTVYHSGFHDYDGGEDEYAFDCAGRTYAYARRTQTLAGIVVDNRAFPPSRWASARFPAENKASIPAQALERFCALKGVPAK
jgi:hypothetical protein